MEITETDLFDDVVPGERVPKIAENITLGKELLATGDEKDLQHAVERGFARLVELHEECIQKQNLQNQLLQSQLQTVIADQSSLRTFLKQQLEDLLVGLRPESKPSKLLFQSNLPKEEREVEPNAAQNGESANSQTAGSRSDNSQTAGSSSDEKVSKAQPPKKELQVIKKAGTGVLFDLSKLPQDWTHETPAVGDGEKKITSYHSFARRIVESGWFDAFFISVIFANLLTICIQLQWRGYHLSMMMGERDDDNGWSKAKDLFQSLEFVYTSCFAIETILRVSVLGCAFLRVNANVFDTFIVLITCIQFYILEPFGLMKDASFIGVARLIRLVRVMRFLKVVRFAEACSELRVLARALSGCLGSLIWSMLLLVSLILAGAVVLFQISLAYMEDESNPEIWRRWAFEHLGTLTLSMNALWECTFTGSWHRYSFNTMVNMKSYYAFFWVPYIVCVNFSVMRLIGALFLKEIMSVAAVDAEKMSMAKLKRSRDYAALIKEIFQEADASRDGQISAEEFLSMLYNPHVGRCFEQIDLEVSEVAVLFELLAADDGQANYHEFLEGALKLKQPAQTIDIIQLTHGNQKLGGAMETVYDGVCDLADFLGKALDKSALAYQLDDQDAHSLFVRTGDKKTTEGDTDLMLDAPGDS